MHDVANNDYKCHCPADFSGRHCEQKLGEWSQCTCMHTMLLDRCPVCNVGVLCPSGWMDQDATWFGGRPRPRRHCVRCKLSAPPPTERGTKAPFSVHCFGKVAHLSNCRASDLVNVNAATINYKFTILSHVTISPWFLSTK